MFDLGKKNYIIFGASSGVGIKISEHLMMMKDVMTILVARDTDKVNSLLQKNPKAFCLRCDLKETNQIENVFSILRQKKIKLDGLVYCAGISPLMKVIETDIPLMRDTFQVNVLGFIECMKWFLREDVSNCKASVVAMSSVAANIPTYRQTVYSASKSALEETVRCVAKEGKERHIRVNAISAGAIDTDMLKKLCEKSDSLKYKFEQYYPFGLISTEKIAQNISYLLSDMSSNTTGSVLSIDSGFLINK